MRLMYTCNSERPVTDVDVLLSWLSVQLKHDWRVVADSHRVKVQREDQDHWTMTINNAIHLDEGRPLPFGCPPHHIVDVEEVISLYECLVSMCVGQFYTSAVFT